MKYKIESEAGEDMGIYEGTTKAEALAAMHREAGYNVHVLDDKLVFVSDEDEALCGTVDDYYITKSRLWDVYTGFVEAMDEDEIYTADDLHTYAIDGCGYQMSLSLADALFKLHTLITIMTPDGTILGTNEWDNLEIAINAMGEIE